MKLAMDEVSFKRQGTEVRMRKASGPKREVPAWGFWATSISLVDSRYACPTSSIGTYDSE
jgi:hypothetical protein